MTENEKNFEEKMKVFSSPDVLQRVAVMNDTQWDMPKML